MPKTGAVGRFFVTPHAVRRYRERFRPSVSFEQARTELTQLTTLAKLVRTDADGCEMWRGPKLGKLKVSRIRFLVSRKSEGELPVVITVLRHG